SCGIVLAVVASVAWGMQSRVPPGFVLLPLAVAAALTLAGRAAARRALLVRRRRGQCVQSVVAVGPEPAVRALVAHHDRLRLPCGVIPDLYVCNCRYRARYARNVFVVLVFALVALDLLAPVLVGIAVVVRATSPGPALFRQTRLGVGGREFTFLKFRTMHVG